MALKDLLQKLRARTPERPASRDWTNSWNARDWADLPTYHPRTDRDRR